MAFIDVTELYQTQNALNISEARYQSIFDNALYSIVVYSPDGVIQMINKNAAQKLGKTQEELVGKPLADVVYHKDHEEIVDFLQQVIEQNDTVTIEEEILFEGKPIIIWSMAQPIHTGDNKIASIQVISHDITEQRTIEKLRQQQNELQISLTKERQLSQLRTGLITTISHEFRTPMTVIQTNCEMLIRYKDKLSEDRKADKLQQIISQVQLLANILTTTRTLNDVNQNLVPYNPTPIDIEEFIHQVEASFHESDTYPQNLVIRLDLKQSIINLDAELIRQALMNLLNNASKYSPENSTITLHVIQHNTFTDFCVEDQGIGIATSDIEHILKPFYRGRNTSTVRGTGLGLALVNEFIKLHQGQLLFETEINKGSRFIIRLKQNH